MGEIDSGVKTFSRIFSLSFSGKKIVIQILGCLCACIVSGVILGLGGLIFKDWLYSLVQVINWVIVIFILFITWGAISKITISEVAGLPPIDVKTAIRSALKCARSLVFAPLKIVAIILILMLIHVVAGWIGLIPFVGTLVWPFFAIPLFLLSGFIVVSGIILLCGGLLLPPIIMVGKESPVSELNDFLRENTLRFIGYLIATVIVVSLVFFFLNMVVTTDAKLSTVTMGGKYSTVVASVPAKLIQATHWIQLFIAPLRIYPSTLAANLVGTGHQGVLTYDLGWTYRFAGFIWGIFALIINLSIISLPFVVWCVSGTLIYLGLKPASIPKA